MVALARDEADMHRHDAVGPEHIVAGLLRESDGVAAQVLNGLQIPYKRRIVHVKLDILWAERENRRRRRPDAD